MIVRIYLRIMRFPPVMWSYWLLRTYILKGCVCLVIDSRLVPIPIPVWLERKLHAPERRRGQQKALQSS
jgi:hypothetical protein